jgi:hypothetical protein
MLRYILAVAMVGVLGAHAFAADAASQAVTIPYGDWLTQVLEWARNGLVCAACWAVSKYAPPLVRQFLTDKYIGDAVNYALAAVEGADAGKTLTLPIANQVIAHAEAYAVASLPRFALWLVGELRPVLIAKLSAAGLLPPEASAQKLGAAPAAPK